MIYIDSIKQVTSFGVAILFGIAFSVLYSFIKSFEKTINRTWCYITFDICFFLVAAITTFSYMLVKDNGVIRYYVILGMALGFLLFRILFGKIFDKLFGYLFNVSKCLLGLIEGLLRKIDDILSNIIKKLLILSKKTLQQLRHLLYNIPIKNMNDSEKECGEYDEEEAE